MDDLAQSLTPEPNTQTNQENVSPGLQARIDELTANWRETQRQLAVKDQQVAALMQQALQRPQAPQEAEPELDIDPEDQKKFDLLFRRFSKPFEQQISQLQQRLQQTQVLAVQGEVGKFTQDASVAAEAQKLLQAWSNHPVYRDATPEDAVNIAYGKLFREGKVKAPNAQPAINELALDVPAPGRAAPVSRSQKSVDLNSYDVEDIAANLGAIEQKLGDYEF